MGSNPNWTSDELKRRAVQRRAVEAVIWGMPAVNTDLMYQALVQLKGGFNQIVYWSGLPSWKNQTLTPNPDSIYLMPFHNTKDARLRNAGSVDFTGRALTLSCAGATLPTRSINSPGDVAFPRSAERNRRDAPPSLAESGDAPCLLHSPPDRIHNRLARRHAGGHRAAGLC